MFACRRALADVYERGACLCICMGFMVGTLEALFEAVSEDVEQAPPLTATSPSGSPNPLPGKSGKISGIAAGESASSGIWSSGLPYNSSSCSTSAKPMSRRVARTIRMRCVRAMRSRRMASRWKAIAKFSVLIFRGRMRLRLTIMYASSKLATRTVIGRAITMIPSVDVRATTACPPPLDTACRCPYPTVVIVSKHQ